MARNAFTSRRLMPILAMVAIAASARVVAAQGVAGVLGGGDAIAGSACPAGSAAERAVVGDSIERTNAVIADTGAVRRDSAAGVAIVLLAEASAREVRFARQPRISVRLCGGIDSIRVLERRNLPRPIVVGRTYRDVRVAVEILGRVNAACITERLTGTGPAAGRQCAAITIDAAVANPAAPPP